MEKGSFYYNTNKDYNILVNMNWNPNKRLVEMYCNSTGRTLSFDKMPSSRNRYRYYQWISTNERSVLREVALSELLERDKEIIGE